MPAWICVRCGVQSPDTPRPPDGCPVCADEREALLDGGQRWTTADELAADHVTELREEEPDLVGVGVAPSFGIGQRALLVRTPQGNVLWDCVPLLDDAARTTIAGWGGIAAICPSHPHFYGACVDVADAFGARILIARADAEWVQRPSPRVELFDDEIEPVPGVTALSVGGHFDGSAVLHWAGGAGGRGALLTGDTIMVVEDRAWVSFMWSYPNLLPLGAPDVDRIARRVARFDFARVYGGWWGHVVTDAGADVVARSAHRYVERLHGRRPGRSGA
ncbi:hypothetical protein [Pseudonocardia lacus]|uniref:hypothetical protein n=1 Tax=Pseudonocardia lacus TaxID=2835865 RepID=UPI001BDC56CE|nr:hypothetical protein [Pseudonocardia lacus]